MSRDFSQEWTSVPLDIAKAAADPHCLSCRGTAIAWENPGQPDYNIAPHTAICRCAGGVCWNHDTKQA